MQPICNDWFERLLLQVATNNLSSRLVEGFLGFVIYGEMWVNRSFVLAQPHYPKMTILHYDRHR